MVSMVETNRSALLLDGATKAAKALGVSLDWLVGLTDDRRPAAELSRLLSAPTSSGQGLVIELDAALAPGNVPGARPVPVRELAAAAGGGAVDLDETIVGYLYFRLDWLDQQALEPSQCDVIRVSGESMDPTLPDGCSILVDRSRRSRRHGRIYVARTDEGVVVKRLLHVRGRWTLSSDNTAWRSRTWPPTAEVIGEVRWMAQTL